MEQIEEATAIYSILLAHASHSLLIPQTTIIDYPAPTEPPYLLSLSLSGFSSERIHQALIQNANAKSKIEQFSSASMNHKFSRLDMTSTTIPSSYGYLTNSFLELTFPIPILLGVVIILIGLFFLFYGSRSFNLASHWGRKRGYSSGDAYLSGGIGGIICGGLGFGTLSTLLILIVVSKDSNANLGNWSLFAITLSSSLLGMGIAGKFKWVARTILGLLSGLTFTLLLLASISIPTLLPRLIILSVAFPLSLLLSLLPKTRPHFTFFSTALVGSYFLLLGIDFFLHLSFLDLLSGLISVDGVDIKNGGEEGWIWGERRGSEFKGLVAVWWILMFLGTGVQVYFGRINSGEEDEGWNAYLGELLSTSPSSRGTFTPFPSFFSRLFSRNKRRTRSSHTALTDLPGSYPLSDSSSSKFKFGKKGRGNNVWDESDAEEVRGNSKSIWDSRDEWDDDEITLNGIGGSSAPAKYKAHESDDEEDEVERNRLEEEEEEQEGRDEHHDYRHPHEHQDHHNSDASDTLLGRSDLSLDISSQPTSTLAKRAHFVDSPTSSSPLSPNFASSSTSRSAVPPFSRTSTSTTLNTPTSNNSPLATPQTNLVPATPSLISALKRVSEAQKQSRSGVAVPGVSGDEKMNQFEMRKSVEIERKGSTGSRKWEGFWEEVVSRSRDGSK